ncbi:amidohydrolase 2 [Parafrankia sp. EAN1pec]|uniref:amidohydrolase family protein n=1 Tax=Parafrankia sp. (strain EAN1pec) TaxID=298653 RepID=UPI00005423AE|nr:amidohydrolase 2 [Frankia sp. EAN1pec]
MINDAFVFNAVAHAYDLTDENTQPNRYAHGLRDALVMLHRDWQPGIGLGEFEQRTDWSIETLARTLFLESDVDMAATHTLRLDSYFKDGLCARHKTVEAVRRWPHRFVGYVGVDPTLGLETCLRELDEQLDEMPEAVGLKLYPAQVEPIRSWRMDDPKLAFPLFARAQERGLRTVAVHKASPLGPVPMNPFHLDDIDNAADAFPDLSFEIVHAGLAFAEEAALAIARYPNVYANLEVTSVLLTKSPGVFEQTLAKLIFWGGPSKLIYSDGSMVFHSQPIIRALSEFSFSEETLAAWGIPQLTAEDRALILGGNYARILGIDIEAAKARIADDEFAREKARTGIQAPYSNWKAALEAAA